MHSFRSLLCIFLLSARQRDHSHIRIGPRSQHELSSDKLFIIYFSTDFNARPFAPLLCCVDGDGKLNVKAVILHPTKLHLRQN